VKDTITSVPTSCSLRIEGATGYPKVKELQSAGCG